MQTQTFVFFGQVGSGKGTQIKLLMEYIKTKDNRDIVYGGTGEEFRKILELDNFTAKLIKDSMNKGELQPNFLTTALFTNVLISSLDENKHLIADGYPRTVEQSESFEKMMQFFKRENIKIIYIELSEEEAMKRNLLRGRADDTEEGLRRRFNEYKNNVVPAMNYFLEKAGYEIITINGEQSVEDVHKDIIKALAI
ncbi:MAG TPA: nucleoside monophosphate kinase [Candidatus Paceibacterota bacterium]|nr:nucleoside monophosphate kinase [Candidatus Paceibacterota bacterium]